jgi:hypothetical protein
MAYLTHAEHKAYINLCNYDLRNPDGVISYLAKKDIIEEGYSHNARKNCACDNCFYRRTELAEIILNQLKS